MPSFAGSTPNQVRQRGAILIDAGRGNPHAAIVGVVGTLQHLRRECAVNIAALDGVAHDEVVAAPGVIRTQSRAAAGLQACGRNPTR